MFDVNLNERKSKILDHSKNVYLINSQRATTYHAQVYRKQLHHLTHFYTHPNCSARAISLKIVKVVTLAVYNAAYVLFELFNQTKCYGKN